MIIKASTYSLTYLLTYLVYQISLFSESCREEQHIMGVYVFIVYCNYGKAYL